MAPLLAEIYLSAHQLGARYGVHHLTPRRWPDTDPTFPKAIRLTPGCTRWKLSELEAWESAKAAQPSAA